MDLFKQKNNNEYTGEDLNCRCYVSFSRKETKRLKKMFNKIARKRLKNELNNYIDIEERL